MGIIKILTKAPKIIKKFKPDKITKKVLEGAKGSPFIHVDDLKVKPVFRNPKDLPGTEKKKLKEVGRKISEEFKKIDKEKPLKDLQKGGSKFLRGGGIAQRGLGRAFMKGGKVK
jgi:hypothetical protein